MPIISCYECAAKISDLAPSCPQCGAPARRTPSPSVREASHSATGLLRRVTVWRVVAGYAAAMVGFLCVLATLGFVLDAFVGRPVAFPVPMALIACAGVGLIWIAMAWIAPVRHLAISIAAVGGVLAFFTRSAIGEFVSGNWQDPLTYERIRISAVGLTVLAMGLMGMWLDARRRRSSPADQ
jgi:hypothetical protein